MDRWVSGPGSLGLSRALGLRSLGKWVLGFLGLWVSGSLGFWVFGSLGLSGVLDLMAPG